MLVREVLLSTSSVMTHVLLMSASRRCDEHEIPRVVSESEERHFESRSDAKLFSCIVGNALLLFMISDNIVALVGRKIGRSDSHVDFVRPSTIPVDVRCNTWLTHTPHSRMMGQQSLEVIKRLNERNFLVDRVSQLS